MPDSSRDIDLATILGIEFREVFMPIVGNDASYHDFYSAIADTYRLPVTADLLRSILASDLVHLRQGFEKYFECQGIEEQQLRTAIERTLQSSGQ
jgi:hypothetical protein